MGRKHQNSRTLPLTVEENFRQLLNTMMLVITMHLYISSSDNKSVSHWIMFDIFFSCLKSKHFFNYVPHLFLLTCVKFHGKKIDNNNTLTHICLLPFKPVHYKRTLLYLKKTSFEIFQRKQLH
jgi:hypothetical protein